MRIAKYLGLLTIIVGLAFANTPASQAGVSISIGAAPVCPYGYFSYPPYACAPYGYYGPQWYQGGVFIGAGPWFHGPGNFRGRVNNRFDPHHGYHGAMPARGSRGGGRAPANFRGNEMRDGRGHTVGGKR